MSFGPAARIARLARILALGAACLAPFAAAQSLSDTHVTGQIVGVDADGSGFTGTFDCRGEPVCTGTYQGILADTSCSNTLALSGSLTISGLDLSHAGALTLTVTLGGIDHTSTTNADGTCSLSSRRSDKTVQLPGGWDGTQGAVSATVPDNEGRPLQIAIAFTATRNPPPPPFPMTVVSNITPTTATVTAQFQPRPEDVGKQEGVFVFAHAPASLVGGPKRFQAGGAPVRNLDAGNPCVLASVNSAGQLSAASASTLTPAFTNVLGAQGQSLSLLNNAPTPGVAGATLFAGYGQDAPSMLNGGVYQGAVTVPGAVSCGTMLNSSVVAKSPEALSGLWYNAGEDGWGIYFSQRHGILFAAWFTYDASGKPKWYVSDSCTMGAGATTTTGTCNGNLREVSGPAFFGVPFDPGKIQAPIVGTLQVRFTDVNNGSMTYAVAGQTRTVAITRQSISSTAPVAVNFTDLWFNPGESGWGMAITHQYDEMFLAWFVYDNSGKPTWYVGPACTVSGNSCSGQLYSTTGPPFGAAFDPALRTNTIVGTVKVDFTGPNDGTITYTVDGVSGAKPIQRQTF